MFKCRSSHTLGSLSRSIICLTLGFLIGIRLTTFWYNLQSENTDLPENETLSEGTEITITPLPFETYEQMPQYLFNTTTVLCWVFTSPTSQSNEAIHIRNTWGKRCNKLLFMSTEEDDGLQSVKLNVEEGRHRLWNKTKMALKYIYDHHYDEAEWFLKADDDTHPYAYTKLYIHTSSYVVMENLRYLLYSYAPDIPIYFGAKFKPMVQQGYMSGDTDYVLSKESLRKFVLEAYEHPEICPKPFKPEDVQLAVCLQNIGVLAGDSRDEWGKERFLPLAVEHLLPSDIPYWHNNYTFDEHKENAECCSSKAISFHHVEGQQFYILDYLIYNLRPFGVLGNFGFDLPRKFNRSDVEKMLVR